MVCPAECNLSLGWDHPRLQLVLVTFLVESQLRPGGGSFGLLEDLLEEVVVGRAGLSAILHQMLEERGFS